MHARARAHAHARAHAQTPPHTHTTQQLNHRGGMLAFDEGARAAERAGGPAAI